ncbi:hypothetical protein SD70_02700 [Gordoniibacillus kamchatkensis]|uniref:YolD-like family protein n=1 Tax=Gordoniibacillus kamchatkensis TaxID=1590651 RepID=A0ABR5AM81_9BACL|nr:YolD-like family protein [Paenibacillus sp. VKM B-2647]KIL42109.1 hypothetical protein SD70_02700 [Paenibacillus sp. VKM B-2647]
MGKKLEGNGRWGTRFILPEYQEGFQNLKRMQERHERPILGEDERDEINRAILESVHTGRRLMLTIYDPFQDYELAGIVTKLDQQMRRIKIEHGEEVTWVPFEDVLKALVED